LFIRSHAGEIPIAEAYPSKGTGCEKKTGSILFVCVRKNGCIGAANLLRQ
jgi:hypothetical protein